MKKVLLIMLALLMAAPFAKTYPDGDEPFEIIIGDGGTHNDDPFHRPITEIPIEASYYASLSSLLLSFADDLGSVSFKIENLTTGATVQTVINAVQGDQFFPVTGGAGEYEITFTLSDGHLYTGSFEIE